MEDAFCAGRNSNGGSHGNGTSTGVTEATADEDGSSQVVFLLACIKEEQVRLKQQVRLRHDALIDTGAVAHMEAKRSAVNHVYCITAFLQSHLSTFI